MERNQLNPSMCVQQKISNRRKTKEQLKRWEDTVQFLYGHQRRENQSLHYYTILIVSLLFSIIYMVYWWLFFAFVGSLYAGSSTRNLFVFGILRVGMIFIRGMALYEGWEKRPLTATDIAWPQQIQMITLDVGRKGSRWPRWNPLIRLRVRHVRFIFRNDR